MRLKNRQKPLPNGIGFYCPATKYQAPQWSSFNAQVDGTIAARLANPGVTAQFKLATDRPAVENEVEQYWCAVAARQGWNDFVESRRDINDGGIPQNQSQSFQQPDRQTRQSFGQRSVNVVAGAEVIVEWIASGAEAVPIAIAEKRAAVCSKCPLNIHTGLEIYFTLPVANAIRSALNARREMRLETKSDDRLGICDACGCITKLKVHVPIEKLWPKMNSDTRAALDPNCWLIAESTTNPNEISIPSPTQR